MRKILLATTALLAMTVASQAAIFNIATPDPTSQTGNFSLTPGGAAFNDQVTFFVSGPSTFTIANATNVFPRTTDRISNWSASIWDSVDGIVGNANDVLLFGPQTAGCVLICRKLPDRRRIGFAQRSRVVLRRLHRHWRRHFGLLRQHLDVRGAGSKGR